MNEIKITAFAKINLGLEVLHKMESGFHAINTLFVPVSLHDELTISAADRLSVTCSPDLGIAQEQNIVYKAAKLLQLKYNIAQINANIKIQKNIPSGAGLGGGSSDAAAALIGLSDFLGLGLGPDDMTDIAAELGSDVPFFLRNGIALGSGRGEILEYFDYKLPYHILLINPGIHISTPWAYKILARSNEPLRGSDLKGLLIKHGNDAEALRRYFSNDFEDAVFLEHKALADIKHSLYDYGAALALMSGSGSTMFGLFSDYGDAHAAAEKFDKYFTYINKRS